MDILIPLLSTLIVTLIIGYLTYSAIYSTLEYFRVLKTSYGVENTETKGKKVTAAINWALLISLIVFNILTKMAFL